MPGHGAAWSNTFQAFHIIRSLLKQDDPYAGHLIAVRSSFERCREDINPVRVAHCVIAHIMVLWSCEGWLACWLLKHRSSCYRYV
jgi:hypothetical protein